MQVWAPMRGRTRLARPYEIKRVVREVHVESVHQHELRVSDTLLDSKLGGALLLFRRDGDGLDRRLGVLLRQCARCAAKTATDIQNGLGRVGLREPASRAVHCKEAALTEV